MNDISHGIRPKHNDQALDIDGDVRLVRQSFLFDTDWYLEHYPDVAAMRLDAAEHYCRNGWWLGYAPGPTFDPRQAGAPANRNPLVHALENLTLRNLTFDRRIGDDANPSFRPCPEPSFERPVPGGNSTHLGPGIVVNPADPLLPCRFEGELAVHLHLFHMNMAPDFRRLLETIPAPFDLFVSVSENGGIIAAEKAFAEIGNVRRIIAASFPNVGRDIAPMIAGFGRRLAPYNVVVHMHSKRSDHTPAKRDWAVQLGHNLLGSRGHTGGMLELFAEDPNLGLVFPVYHPSVQNQIRWGANFDTCQDLMARLGASLEETDLSPFPAGSFFAIRGEVLRPLLAGEISFSDFEPEAGQVDGTLAHAIERLFSILCRHLGYDLLQIRAERPYELASMVLNDEPYFSPRLQAFRTAIAPSLPIGSAPPGLSVTVCSGGRKAQPLPYEYLISGANYAFFKENSGGEHTRSGQWSLKPIAMAHCASWIPSAIEALTDCDIAIWVDPNIALVDDVSEHIASVVGGSGAVGAFHHASGISLEAEIERLDERFPRAGIADRLVPLLRPGRAKERPLLESGLLVLDLRHAEMAGLLARWKRIASELQDLPDAQHLAFDLACTCEGVSMTRLSANGSGLRADPRLRHFGMAGAPHPYIDTMPRIEDFVRLRKPSPTKTQRAAMALTMDVIVPVAPDECADSLAQTLQRFAALADPRCRCVIAHVPGANSSLDAVIKGHLSRHPLDVSVPDPARVLRGDLAMILSPGMLLAEGAVQALAEATLADTNARAFVPLTLTSTAVDGGTWSARLARQCGLAAAEFDSAVHASILERGYLPAVVRPDVARELLCGPPETLAESVPERVRECASRAVPSALVLVREADDAVPDWLRNFGERIVARHEPVGPTIAPVAFYLPQFHPFPVNDRLWGAGFSEWRNVVRAKPRFSGHRQPRLPGDLGFYDLRTAETLRQQARLADLHGIYAMAVYYYRFGEQRLMHEPTDLILSDASIPLRFFYCWANEDWTKAWDGRSDEVNLKQDYSPATLSLILDDVVRACSDSRYVRVDGKPVFMVYQLDKLPFTFEMLQALRDGIRDRLGIEICLGTTYNNAFRSEWEELIDFVAQFPPHRTPRKGGRVLAQGKDKPTQFDPSREDFFEPYESVCKQSLESLDLHQLLQPGVCPDWDNSPRRERNAHILTGATDDAFGAWTRRASHATAAKVALDQLRTPFLFVNAWNEWAEGAVLEPHENDGRASLMAFSNNLTWAAGASPTVVKT